MLSADRPSVNINYHRGDRHCRRITTVCRERVRNVLDCLYSSPEIAGATNPCIQGWLPDDYLRCVDMYESRGIFLAKYPIVGVGSVVANPAAKLTP